MAAFQTMLTNDEEWALEIGKPAVEDGEEAGESGVPGYLQGEINKIIDASACFGPGGGSQFEAYPLPSSKAPLH
jgi:hypothetical protein